MRFPARYQQPRLVANGGMGSVYCAEDTVLQRVVAIKVLDQRFTSVPRSGSGSPARRSPRPASQSDPHTVTTFDVGGMDGRPFIVMEYLSGRFARRGALAGGRAAAARVL